MSILPPQPRYLDWRQLSDGSFTAENTTTGYQIRRWPGGDPRRVSWELVIIKRIGLFPGGQDGMRYEPRPLGELFAIAEADNLGSPTWFLCPVGVWSPPEFYTQAIDALRRGAHFGAVKPIETREGTFEWDETFTIPSKSERPLDGTLAVAHDGPHASEHPERTDDVPEPKADTSGDGSAERDRP